MNCEKCGKEVIVLFNGACMHCYVPAIVVDTVATQEDVGVPALPLEVTPVAEKEVTEEPIVVHETPTLLAPVEEEVVKEKVEKTDFDFFKRRKK